MSVEDSGLYINYLTLNELVYYLYVDIYYIPFYIRIFTKKHICNICGGKIVFKSKNIYMAYNTYFKISYYCDCCGTAYIKDGSTLLYFKEKSLINERKAKLNKLLKI